MKNQQGTNTPSRLLIGQTQKQSSKRTPYPQAHVWGIFLCVRWGLPRQPCAGWGFAPATLLSLRFTPAFHHRWLFVFYNCVVFMFNSFLALRFCVGVCSPFASCPLRRRRPKPNLRTSPPKQMVVASSRLTPMLIKTSCKLSQQLLLSSKLVGRTSSHGILYRKLAIHTRRN